MTNKSIEERMLDLMIADARQREPEPLDVALLERTLRDRWSEQRVSSRRRAVTWRWALCIAAGIAALIGGAATQFQRTHGAGQPLGGIVANQDLDAKSLRVGAVIEAHEKAVAVTYDGRAHWTLAPQGRSTVVALAPYFTVRLDAGRLDAEVNPSPQPESFAVEARGKRIAVHGTRFSVELDSEGVLVEVSKGSVIVGAAGRPGQTQGLLMTAPQRIRFPNTDMLPRTTDARLPMSESSSSHKPRTAASALAVGASNPVAVAPSASGEALQERPTPIEQNEAIDRVRAAAARCFAQSKASDAEQESHLLVRVESKLSITIDPRGALEEISFLPPVPSDILECTRREVGDFAASRSQFGSTLSRTIMLTK